jgi:hypothetical protein
VKTCGKQSSAYSLTLKMEATCFSEMSVDFPRTTQRYIPEDSTLQNRRCEILKSYMAVISLSCLAYVIGFETAKLEYSDLLNRNG